MPCLPAYFPSCDPRPRIVRSRRRARKVWALGELWPEGLESNPRLEVPRLKIRSARVGDVPAIQELIRTFADRKLMIRRSLGELYESIREFLVAVDDEGQVVGCAAVHVFWEDLAELKCLAVAERLHGH